MHLPIADDIGALGHETFSWFAISRERTPRGPKVRRPLVRPTGVVKTAIGPARGLDRGLLRERRMRDKAPLRTRRARRKTGFGAPCRRRDRSLHASRSEEHTSELQSH